ncbi:MAG: RagB/SusD family nutrient uptake outer membrane protein [Phycisphaerales bacterium]|nr:RagB/SusD family nutrient uptake outer membrane protein [Phycisphaerales bacterium]
MKLRILQSILGLLLVLSFSCKKVTDLSPNDALTNLTAFSTPPLCLASLYGIYATAQNVVDNGNAPGAFGSLNIEYADVRGEDVISTAAFLQDPYQNTQNASSTIPYGYWNALYRLINQANLSIAGFQYAQSNNILDKATATQYIAEATLWRAIAHHELVLNYARPYLDGSGSNLGVPYRNFPIQTLADLNRVAQMPRNTVAEDYSDMLSDVTGTIDNLPAVPDNNTRLSQAVALAFRMRLNLHVGNYLSVVDDGNTLVPSTVNPLDWNSVVCPIGGWAMDNTADGPFANNNSLESMFSIRNTQQNNPGTNAALAAFYGSGSLGGRGLVAISPIIWNDINNWSSYDSRRSLLTTTGTNGSGGNNYFTTKYRDYGGYGDYAPQYRYPEIILMLAEATVRTTQQVNQRGVDLLNLVRNRNLTNPATQQYTIDSFPNGYTQLLARILYERRVEFLCEGKRWADISRLSKDPVSAVALPGVPEKYVNGFGDLSAYVLGGSTIPTQPQAPLAYSAFNYIWPIPIQEIVNNPIIQQNPGY